MATDYKSIFKDFNPATPEKEVLDMQGSSMEEVFKGFKPVEPSVAPETVEAATRQPVGRPASAEAPTGVPMETQEVQPEVPVDPSMAFATGFGQLPELQPVEELSTTQQQMYAAGEEWMKTEALPSALGMGASLVAAPFTGGMSLMASIPLVAAAAGTGAAIGEAAEQTLKYTGKLPLGAQEEAPKDMHDILSRSAWRGGEEALWNLIPDVVLQGIPAAKKAAMFAGGKKAVDEMGNLVDVGKQNMIDFVKEYADEYNLQYEDLLLASDVTDAAAFKFAEDTASNSYFTGKVIKERQALKGEAIKEKIRKTVGQYVETLEDTPDLVKTYVEANFKGLNDFGVASLVNSAFNKAEDAQASIAKSIYDSVGQAMEGTTTKEVYREVNTNILDANTGNPMTRMMRVSQEQTAFPVNLTGVREIGEREMEESLFGVDSIVTRTAALPDQAPFNIAAANLKKLKALQRGLKKSTSEDAPMKSRVVNEMISKLDESLEATAKQAESSGVTMPDGSSVYEAKKKADALWKEKVEDFQNKYLKAIMDNTNLKNGAPDKLSKLFIQNETASNDIMKVINDAKATLPEDSPEFAKIVDAENAIKGSVMQDILAPIDPISGEFQLPNTKLIKTKADALQRLFGEEGFAEIKKLGSALDYMDQRKLVNYLGFAQRARESGLILSTLKNFTSGDRNVIGPLLKEGGATVLMVFGGRQMLTNPKNIKYATMLHDPKTPFPVKITVAKNLAHQLIKYNEALEATMTPEEKEMHQAREDDQNEYRQLFNSKE